MVKFGAGGKKSNKKMNNVSSFACNLFKLFPDLLVFNLVEREFKIFPLIFTDFVSLLFSCQSPNNFINEIGWEFVLVDCLWKILPNILDEF
jgi:hypothetical protein